MPANQPQPDVFLCSADAVAARWRTTGAMPAWTRPQVLYRVHMSLLQRNAPEYLIRCISRKGGRAALRDLRSLSSQMAYLCSPLPRTPRRRDAVEPVKKYGGTIKAERSCRSNRSRNASKDSVRWFLTAVNTRCAHWFVAVAALHQLFDCSMNVTMDV